MPITRGENMSYCLLHFIRIINNLITEAILNKYVPIVKIINSNVLTFAERYGKNTNAAYGKTELINKQTLLKNNNFMFIKLCARIPWTSIGHGWIALWGACKKYNVLFVVKCSTSFLNIICIIILYYSRVLAKIKFSIL